MGRPPMSVTFPPAPALAGMREVVRVAAGPHLTVDEQLAPLLAWAEATYGPGLAAQGDGQWLTLYAPAPGPHRRQVPRQVPERDDDPVHPG